jgi:hypothetical protein
MHQMMHSGDGGPPGGEMMMGDRGMKSDHGWK